MCTWCCRPQPLYFRHSFVSSRLLLPRLAPSVLPRCHDTSSNHLVHLTIPPTPRPLSPGPSGLRLPRTGPCCAAWPAAWRARAAIWVTGTGPRLPPWTACWGDSSTWPLHRHQLLAMRWPCGSSGGGWFLGAGVFLHVCISCSGMLLPNTVFGLVLVLDVCVVFAHVAVTFQNHLLTSRPSHAHTPCPQT